MTAVSLTESTLTELRVVCKIAGQSVKLTCQPCVFIHTPQNQT